MVAKSEEHVTDFLAEKARRRAAEQKSQQEAATHSEPVQPGARLKPRRRMTTAEAARRIEPYVAERWSPRRTFFFVVAVCSGFWLAVAIGLWIALS